MEVAVVETSNRVSNFKDYLMYASASLTFFQSTWYGANSATFFSDLNLCKYLQSAGHACNTQIANLKPNCFQLFSSILPQRRRKMETYIYTICFQLRSVRRCQPADYSESAVRGLGWQHSIYISTDYKLKMTEITNFSYLRSFLITM